MSLLQNSNAISAGGYDVNNSLRIRSSASAYLSRTFSTAQTDSRKITVSFWMKLGSLIGSGTNQTLITGYNGSSPGASGIGIQSDILTFGFGNNSAGNDARLVTTQVFRDPSAWYHIMCVGDSTLATSTDRMKVYINGVQVTAISTYNAPNLNLSCQIGVNTANNRIGTRWNTGSEYAEGYFAEFNVIDGQALTPSSFGETDTATGSWKPKAYTGTYGNNGYYLKFSDIATTSGSNVGLGKDFSGNGNFWNTTNISVTAGTTYDAMTDSPTLTSATVSNYPTLNPIYISNIKSAPTLVDANLATNTAYDRFINATMALPSSGKFYWEATVLAATSGGNQTGLGLNTDQGDNRVQQSFVSTLNDVWGVAANVDSLSISWYKNGVLQTTSSIPSGKEHFPFFYTDTNASPTHRWSLNFGQRPFSYTPPSGFVRLNTYNIPDSTIKKGNSYMDATIYTGNGASNRTIVNAGGFRPDLAWVKARNFSSSHGWGDSVRGNGNILRSDNDLSELTSRADILNGFASNGFIVGADGISNGNGNTYVGWQWQAGQGTNTTNTAGSRTSTVSVNTTAGFSIVTYTGSATTATVGHGLGVVPKFIIIKNRSAGVDWRGYHVSLGSTAAFGLNLTATADTNIAYFNNTNPTSSVFSLGSSFAVNGSGNAIVAWCWAEVAGFSKFGSYVANASANGPFIYTGFRPKWIMFKRTTSATNWYVIDTAISPYNSSTTGLYPNTAAAVSTEGAVNILSNGFKCAQSSGAFNFPSGETFMYAAFAENPFKNSNAR